MDQESSAQWERRLHKWQRHDDVPQVHSWTDPSEAVRVNGIMPNAIGAAASARVPAAQPGSEKLQNLSFDALLLGLLQTVEIGKIGEKCSDCLDSDPRAPSHPPLNWKPESENLLPELDPRLLPALSWPTLKPEPSILTDTPKSVADTPKLEIEIPSPEIEFEALKCATPEAAPIDFDEFEVRKFEFITERDPLEEAGPKAQSKPRESDHFVTTPLDIRPHTQFAQRLIPVEQVYSVKIPDLPPPPPMVRRVSMEVGDGDTQVKITIHERNGALSVRFDSASDLIRRDLEDRAGTLVEALHREQIQVLNFEFRDSFGSATESDNAPNRHPRQRKGLKPGALLADEDETTQFLPADDTDKTNKISY
jgi:hypothetical protein